MNGQVTLRRQRVVVVVVVHSCREAAAEGTLFMHLAGPHVTARDTPFSRTDELSTATPLSPLRMSFYIEL